MKKTEDEMTQLRQQLQHTDQRRKQEIQSSATSLDNLVEEMLVETKKLEMRVENLRRGYDRNTEHENTAYGSNERFKKKI